LNHFGFEISTLTTEYQHPLNVISNTTSRLVLLKQEDNQHPEPVEGCGFPETRTLQQVQHATDC